ncbi:MAG: hypothetical protein WAU57_16305 [Xanthobacteraceae bacterium]
MIPYKWPVATAIPQNPMVRREIVKAMRVLIEDGDEQFSRRRAEIAAIRLGLEEIARDIAKICREAPSLILSELRKYGYNPEEPRVPRRPGTGSLDQGRFEGEAVRQYLGHQTSRRMDREQEN